jgi:hypothetical protein
MSGLLVCSLLCMVLGSRPNPEQHDRVLHKVAVWCAGQMSGPQLPLHSEPADAQADFVFRDKVKWHETLTAQH